MPVTEFRYRIPWRAAGAFPGSHAGRHHGSGFEIATYAPLPAAADPRRFDVRASLRDPFGRVVVRVYNQLSSVPIHGLADVSGSMGFKGRNQKWNVLADFATSLAYSAQRSGDTFAFSGCDASIRPELTFAMTRDKLAGVTLDERLRTWIPDGKSSDALLTAAERLPSRRALVFLISDFHFPIALLRNVLRCLSIHYVVPVMLWDSAEAEVPRLGIARLYDPESGVSRTLLVRRSLGVRLGRIFRSRRQLLQRCFAEHGLTPLVLGNQFEADAVTRYFYG